MVPLNRTEVLENRADREHERSMEGKQTLSTAPVVDAQDEQQGKEIEEQEAQ